MLKPANTGRAWGEDRTLPIAVDGLEKSEMKERSEIKPDASPNAMSTKPVVSYREAKEGMRQRLISDA